MKTNPLIFDLLRGKWLMNIANISEYEKLANQFISGQYRGEPVDRKAFRASYSQGNSDSLLSEKEEKKIGYLQIVGPMTTYGDMCTYGADDYLYALRRLNENEKVGAIVLDIDGPGGAVSAINAFKEFQLEKSKPIVALCNECYSLHYWMVCLIADHVMARGNISSGFGSIGSTCILIDSREAMAKEGYKVMIINAPGSELKNKASQNFYEGNDEEFVQRLRAELKPIRDAFVQDVKKAFPQIEEDERIFMADTFTADEALKFKMIHSIGNEKKAFELAKALSEINN